MFGIRVRKFLECMSIRSAVTTGVYNVNPLERDPDVEVER